MAIGERERHTLHQSLDEVMGEDAASILMEHLPPVGWADVATKHDLAQLEDRLGLRLDVFVGDVRAELHTEIGALRSELHNEIGNVRGEIGALRGEIGTLRGEMGTLRGEIGTLRSDLSGEIGTLRGEIGALRSDLDGKITRLGADLHAATRTFLFGIIGLAFTIAAIAFGAAQLV